MVTATFPVSLLESTCNFAVSCSLPQVPAKRRQADAVVRAQTGDHEAFSELYLKHKRRVFAICMRMVRDYALAEDLTQETFLQVHRKLASFRGDSVFSTWLHRLAVNTVLMHLRKRGPAVVSLDYLMESVPDERVGRSFGTRDLTQAGVIDRLAIERIVATWRPVIAASSSFMTFTVLIMAKLPQCSNAPAETQNPNCTRRGARCAAPFPHKQSPAPAIQPARRKTHFCRKSVQAPLTDQQCYATHQPSEFNQQ
jgi:hypothetical protein